MRIQKRLQINGVASLIAAVAILLVLFVALNEIKHARREADIAGDILNGAFDRYTQRNDYLNNNNERAKEEWLRTNERINMLLSMAKQDFHRREDRAIIDRLFKDQEANFRLFSAVVENREKAVSAGSEAAAIYRETEKRLVGQLDMLAYERAMSVGRLRESAEQHLFSTLRMAGGGLVLLIAAVAAAAMINSLSMGRAIVRRIRRLRDGVSIIGEGDLAFRIDTTGDDEFAELSGSFNAMTAKLQASHQSLESEIATRRQTETLLSENEGRLKRSQEFAHLGSWELDVVKDVLTWSDEVYRIFGLQPQEFGATYEAFLSAVHPDDRAAVDEAYAGSLREGRDTYEIEHRVVRKSTGEVRYVHEKCRQDRPVRGNGA
jgi:PAS domain S-box-containing protein